MFNITCKLSPGINGVVKPTTFWLTLTKFSGNIKLSGIKSLLVLNISNVYNLLANVGPPSLYSLFKTYCFLLLSNSYIFASVLNTDLGNSNGFKFPNSFLLKFITSITTPINYV